MSIKIVLLGCNGRMARMFANTAAAASAASAAPAVTASAATTPAATAPAAEGIEIVAGVDIVPASAAGAPTGNGGGGGGGGYKYVNCAGMGAAEIAEALSGVEFDAAVDFSHASALGNALALATGRSKPALLAATGYTAGQQAEISEAAKAVPIFQSMNLSLGVSLMTELVRRAAAALADGYDIEIVEAHHNQKLDAPSGTAYMIADAIQEEVPGGREYVYDRHSVRAKRGKNEIGIHSVRGGTIVGEHEVIFAGNDEVIKISHSAYSRVIYAEGAIRALRFITDPGRKPGRYAMRDLVRSIAGA